MATRSWSSIVRMPWSVLAAVCVLTGSITALPAADEYRIRLSATSGAVFDDFLGSAGSAPNGQLWDYDLGGGGWGNNELQVYTNSPDNVRLDGQGNLLIQARRSGGGYTSARLVTRGKAEMKYGTLMARIKFPGGQGLWPGLWLLGSNATTVGWPQCGEIDVMELPNSGTTYHTALHGPWTPPRTGYWSASASGPAGVDLTAGFHNYWVYRQPGTIMIGIDGVTRGYYTRSSLPAEAQWVFEQPMFALLNVAVGGDWPGPPDDSTTFPATMVVDWFKYTP